MSQNNSPTVIDDATTDLTDDDLNKVKEYVDAGLPQIATVDGDKLTQVMDLYLSGKPYRQISQVMNLSLPMILYFSYKYNWFLMKKDYITDLEQSMRGRMIESKIVNQDFLLQLIHMWQKKIGDKITKYLASDDEKYAKEIDLKEIDKYLKTVEILHRLSAEPKPGAPAVGLNLGDGVTVTKGADGSVEITPKVKAIGDMLRQMADSKREEERETNNNKKPK